jgi:hypothetical protein
MCSRRPLKIKNAIIHVHTRSKLASVEIVSVQRADAREAVFIVFAAAGSTESCTSGALVARDESAR